METQLVNVAVDVMGGDFAPGAIMDGVAEVLSAYGDNYHLLLVGPEATVAGELKRIGYAGDPRVEIVNATQVVEMGEHAAAAYRNKRDSSISVCAGLVKEKRAEAMFSAGNTGAAVASAYFKWRMIPGIDRPGLAALFPGEREHFLLMDAGANVDCSPINLLQYALMGSIYMRDVMKRENPRVGLLCNGTEEGKGNKLVQEAYGLLKSNRNINFVGNVEGHGLFAGDVDVVVCDGFVGNVFLKSGEQLAIALGHKIKNNVMKNPLWMLGGFLMKGAVKLLRKETDYANVGGVPLLGVAGACIIGHGISNARAVRNGIAQAGECVRRRVNETIAEQVKEQVGAAEA